MTVLAWIWSKASLISLKAWGYIAALFAVLAALLKIFNAGKTAQKSADQEKVLDDVKAKTEVDGEVRSAGGDAARDELLRHYSRD